MGVSPKETTSETGGPDLANQVRVLKAELAQVREELERASRRTANTARNLASDGVEALKAQGEMAYDKLRHGASDLEDEIARHVREKPATSLVIAAGIGFLVAQMLRR